ncbi:MAG: hypothetical protein K8R79_04750 [Calditrichales bacterium]|nr:hypothetical protein [Calditrichales bacterium]
MKKITVLLFSLILVFAFSAFSVAGDDDVKIESKFGSTIQAWGSFGQASDTDSTGNQFGFGLRRIRVRYYTNIGDKIKGYIQVEAINATLYDARIEYYFTPDMHIRMGRFVGAGPRGGGNTSHTKTDILERAQSTIYWAKNTVGGDFRDYGAEFRGKFSDLEVRLFLHNGDGSFNLRARQGDDATEREQNESLAASGMLLYKPKAVKGLETGGHFGIGNKDINEYTTYSGYVYYEPKPLRIKAEVIGLTKPEAQEDTVKNKWVDQSMLGYYVFAAYGVTPNVELLARYETLDPNTDSNLGKDDETNYITAGISYKQFSGKINSKITAAVVMPQEAADEIDNMTAYIQFQIVF